MHIRRGFDRRSAMKWQALLGEKLKTTPCKVEVKRGQKWEVLSRLNQRRRNRHKIS